MNIGIEGGATFRSVMGCGGVRRTSMNLSSSENSQNIDTGSVFRGLADLVYRAGDYAEIHQAICDAAPMFVAGCDHASLMLKQRGRFITAGASDDIAREIDQLERDLRAGPCVDAIVDETAHIAPDLAVGSAWPRLTEQVLARTPVRGMAGFRILIDDRVAGALNLFSDTPGALTERSINEAAVLAAFASVAMMAGSRQEAATTLRSGLESNREIGIAVGLLMAFHKFSDDDAFAMLRKTSQDMNIKLSEVAREIVQHHRNRKPR